MSLLVVHSDSQLPIGEGAIADLVQTDFGSDLDTQMSEKTVVVTRSTKRSDVDLYSKSDEIAAVFGDAYLHGTPLSAIDFAGITEERIGEINGEFAGILKRDGKLLLVTDPLNVRQLYCYRSSSLFIAASGILPIIRILGELGITDELSLNFSAFAQLLDFRHLLGLKTYINEISLVPGATIRTVTPDTDGLSQTDQQYCEIEYGNYYEDESTAVEAITEALKQSLSLRCGHSQKVGLHLSGGLDSRLVLAAVPSTTDLSTYTFGVPGSDEVAIARWSAEASNRDWDFCPLSSYIPQYAKEGVQFSDGQVTVNSFHHVPSLTYIRQRCDKLLLGTLFDSIFGGQAVGWAKQTLSSGTTETLTAEQMYENRSGFSSGLWDDLFDGQGRLSQDDSKDSFIKSFDSISEKNPYNKAELWNLNNRKARWYFPGSTQLPSAYLPVSNPATDRRLIEAAFRLSPEMRLSTDIRAQVLSRLSRRLSLVPYSNTWTPPAYQQLKPLMKNVRRIVGYKPIRRALPIVGAEVKFGRSYPDYTEWLRKDREFFDFTESKVRSFAERGYCDIGEAIRALERHRSGEENYISELMNIVTLELWHECVVDNFPEIDPDVAVQAHAR